MNNIPENIKCFKDFVYSVISLNQFRFGKHILDYQYQILQTGVFRVISPYSGRKLKLKGNFLWKTHKIYYWFAENSHTVFLVTDDIGWGWPIRFLIFPKEEKVYAMDNDSDVQYVERNDLLRKAKAFRNTCQPRIRINKIRVLLGHPNFAHYLWNEVSALNFLLNNDDLLSDIFKYELLNLFQPLGSVEKLVNHDTLEKAFSSIITVHQMNDINSQYAGTILRIGARFITNKLKENLRKQVKDQYGERPKQFSQNNCPVFWISIKDVVSNRICLNQLEFLNRLIVKTAAVYPGCKFILDSFSLPVDFNKNPMYEYYREQFNLLKDSGEKERQTLIDRCVTENASLRDKFILTDSYSIFSSLYYGQFADFYVCHAGTLQHKIGWLHSVPGIIHLPQAYPGHAKWYISQTEKSADVFLLPDEFIEEQSLSNKIPRNRDYIIRDIEAAIVHSIQKIKHYI